MKPMAKDFEKMSRWLKEGEIKPIIGRTVDFRDVKAVENACRLVYEGK